MSEKVNVTKQINVPVATVWTALSKIGGLERWFPIIDACSVEGEGVGAIRTCVLGNGAELLERIDEINHQERRFSYAITDSPLPISNYIGTVEVSDSSTGDSTISWTAEFDVPEEARDEMIQTFSGAFSDGIDGLEADLQKS